MKGKTFLILIIIWQEMQGISLLKTELRDNE